MPKGPHLLIQENWTAQAKLKDELRQLEAIAPDDRKDVTAVRIARVKADLIALNISMNLFCRSLVDA
jgi:hypothetical protein